MANVIRNKIIEMSRNKWTNIIYFICAAIYICFIIFMCIKDDLGPVTTFASIIMQIIIIVHSCLGTIKSSEDEIIKKNKLSHIMLSEPCNVAMLLMFFLWAPILPIILIKVKATFWGVMLVFIASIISIFMISAKISNHFYKKLVE